MHTSVQSLINDQPIHFAHAFHLCLPATYHFHHLRGSSKMKTEKPRFNNYHNAFH
jgi:hypothetical protein